MRRLNEEIREVRIPSETLARWALETPALAKEATYGALAFLVHVEHAAVTLLPVPTVLAHEAAVLDPDGYLRQPRGAVEHLRLRATRAIAWMDLLIFFRERFPAAAQRPLPDADSLRGLARAFSHHDDPLEAAVDLLVHECVLPELEQLLLRTVTYPGLQMLLQQVAADDPQRSAEARRLASYVLGDLSGARLWRVRKRLVTTATRAVLGARPLLDELARGGLKVDRARAARGFVRRLEEAVADLTGAKVLPEGLLEKLAELGAAPAADAREGQPLP